MIAPMCSLFPGHGGREPGEEEGSRRRRYLAVVALVVVVSLLLLPVALGYRSQWDQLRAPPAAGSPRPHGAAPGPVPPPGDGRPRSGAQASPAPDPGWVQFTGTDPLEATVDHDGGLMLVRVAHRAQGPFAVRIGGDEPLVDVTGAYQGSRAFGLPQGTYRVDVAAGGEWGLAIEQPSYTRALRLPRTLEGVGDTATRAFEIATARTVRMSWTVEHDGGPRRPATELRVRVMEVSGAVVADLVVGDGDDVEQHLTAGRYLLDVSTGAGVWRVLVS